jgi:phage-related protein
MITKLKYNVILSDEVGDFLDKLNPKAVRKILTNVKSVALGYQDKELFKKLEGTDIWEFRTLYAGISYRLLAFWDTEENALIITTHGFIKKTNHTPRKEIATAERKRQEYFKLKHK